MKSLQSFVVTSCLTVTALSVAHAAPVRPVLRGERRAADTPFIVFKVADTTIDCKDMGGPLNRSNFTSSEATIEVESSLGVQVDYTSGANLTNGSFQLPTKFQFSVQGLVDFDGKAINSPTEYSAYSSDLERNANQSGTIRFDGNAPKGLKARVVVARNGLSDLSGTYTTQVALNWINW